MKVPRILQAASLLIIGTCALAMPPPQPQQSISRDEARQLQTPTFTYRVTVVSRSVQAVNYRNRGAATLLGFKGTDLMPAAHAQAKVHSKKGYTSIEVEFHELENPTTFGREYLTYVLWAITPEGRSVNLGELVMGGRSSKLDVTTELQAFALIVTAEPYYAVRRPSNVVVLENEVREDTVGTTQAVNAKYELFERGGYIPTGYNFDPVVMNDKLPLEFFEARNALRIAQSEGAEQYASDTYQHAVRLMNQADAYATEKHVDKKTFISVSKEATQTAEDAREISVKRMEAERIDAEASAAADREANAKAQTISAEADTANALRARDEAERQKLAAQASLSRCNRPPRPTPSAIAPTPLLPLPPPNKNSSKRNVNARISAPACCNNSMPSWRLATPLAGWWLTCRTFSSTAERTPCARWRARSWPRSAASCSPIPGSRWELRATPTALVAMTTTRASRRGVPRRSGATLPSKAFQNPR